MHAVNSSQSRTLDQAAQASGIAGFELMRRAGCAAFARIAERYQQANTLLVLAGKGNNGGDAWVVAGAARAAGWTVHLWQVAGEMDKLAGEAGDARDWAYAQGLTVQAVAESSFADREPFDKDHTIVVDGLLGTGIISAPRPDVAAAIDWCNAAKLPVVALDLPSGINADNGAAAGAVVRADLTVTFIAMKLGLLTGLGVDCVGTLILEDLNLDVARLIKQQVAAGGVAPCVVLSEPRVRLPARRPGAYKNEFGHVAVLAGDHGGGGAAILAAEAALRTGAGLVSVGTRAQHVAPLLARRPELMVRDVAGKLAAMELLERASVILVGPGLGQAAWGQQLYAAALAVVAGLDGQRAIPTVIDADALNLIAGGAKVPAHAVLTPHPGEAARLLGCSNGDVEGDRVGAVLELARRYDCVAVLKGAGTLVADSTGLGCVCPLGNPGMATAGMGDSLAGVIAGVVAQQGLTVDWVGRAVQLHAAAGDRVAARLGEASVLAGDLISELPAVLGATVASFSAEPFG